MAPKWHAKAKILRKQRYTLESIGLKLGVSPQAVSIALDPEKQKRRRDYVKKWKQESYKDAVFRARQQKWDREAKRIKRASAS